MWKSGFLEFKLDYAQTKNVATGDFVTSGDFTAGGYLWRIKCFPRGSSMNREYLGIFLHLVSKSKNVKAIFYVFMMERDGRPSSEHAQRAVNVYPPEDLKYTSWGFGQLVNRGVLESRYMVNGSFTVACGVIVLRDDPHRIVVPPSDLGNHLGHLLDCTMGTDVTFVVGGETFPAHRALLAARSPVFKAELFGSMADATTTSITVQDMDPSAFRTMLRFMYTDSLPADDELGDYTAEMLQRLLAAADRYALDRLKLLCAAKLWELVSVDTVASILISAETYGSPGLRRKCIDFFAVETNFKEAAFTDGFAILLQKFPKLAAELKMRVET